MDRSKVVFVEVGGLYQTATTSMGKWMWGNHTQWVAEKAKKLAIKYGADTEKVYCAALLHDLADSRYERDSADFEPWSWKKGKEILKRAGYRHQDREDILEAVSTHSCHPGYLPNSVEGKILATADGMWHLQTSFFPVICFLNRPDQINTYEEWQKWFKTKIERDFNSKIFFEDERNEVREDYEALLCVFGKKTFETAQK